MSYIKSRKHSPSRLNSTLTAAMAGAMLLPVAVHAQQTQQLPSVDVTATQEDTYKTDRSAQGKYTQPLVDTPQTITVINKQLMGEQVATTLTEALRNTPGVGAFYLGENGSTSTGDAVYMRGFDASSAIFVDNVRDIGSVSRDMFNVEQVEVLKGPAGTDSGRGSPTGSINLVTKQAELANYFNASTTIGTGSQKRATADWNKVIDEATGSAFRLNLVSQASGVPGRDMVENSRTGIAPSFVWGLNSPTRIYVDFLHMEQHNRPDGGVPTVGLPGYAAGTTTSSLGRVNSSNYYGLSTDYDNNQTDRFTIRVEHDISPTLKIQNTTRYEKVSQDYLLTSFTTADPTTLLLTRSANRKNVTNEILDNQTNITANLQTGSIKHTLYGGVELTEEKQHALSFTNPTYTTASLYNPNPYAAGTTGTYAVSGYNDGKTDTASAYLFDTLQFNEKWSMTGGVRVDNYHTSYTAVTTTASSFSKSGNLFNWKLAGTYKPTDYSSIYVLYATSQQPPGGANFQLSSTASNQYNMNYAPEKTKTAEIGTKWDLFNKKLAFTAALYNTQVENDVELQDDGSYALTGKKSVKGIELGVTGEITSKWSANLGYTYMKNSVDSGAAVTYTSSGLAYTPNQAFTSWTTYKFTDSFTWGGGARFVGALNRGKDGTNTVSPRNPQYTNSYWVFDTMASYVVSKNVTLQLNVNNIFNKDYVAAINKSGYRYTPGQPRSASLTANFKF